MKLVVISPDHDDPRETAILRELFAAGLERYHVRKPAWSAETLETWLRALPDEWRPRLVLHQHHDLVGKLGLGGVHWRDVEVGRVMPNPPPQRLRTLEERRVKDNAPHLPLTSRSCHDLPTLEQALGGYDSVFFGPLYPSISKPGYGPSGEFSPEDVLAVLEQRHHHARQRHTEVLALGGITPEHLPRLHALGFDGVGVIGAVWKAVDPVRAFTDFKYALACHAA